MMTPEESGSDTTNGDPLPQLARIIYDQMNIEPRQMTVAIKLAKRLLADMQRALIMQGLRSPNDAESTDVSDDR